MQYYKAQHDELINGKPEENRIITLRNPAGGTVITRTGERINPDTDGLYLMKYKDALPLIGQIGWALVDGL